LSYDTILAKSPSIIFRPGAASGGLAVATWAEVQEFVNLREGAVVVYVDDGVAAAHVPAASGVTDFQGRGEIRAYRQDAANYSTLVIDDGATLKSIFRIAGTVELLAATTGAVPAFDFDYTPNVVGTPVPSLWLDDGGFIGTMPAAASPAIVVPAGNTLNLFFSNRAGIFLQSASFLVSCTGASGLDVIASDSSIVGGGSASGNVVTGGAGSFSVYEFDSECQNAGLSPIPPVFATASFGSFQVDTQQLTFEFLATTANVLAALQAQGRLPSRGILHFDIEGFGGTGGGGGGEGGGAARGVGGGGSGGALWQKGGFDFDLSHALNIDVGGGGIAGNGGAAGNNPGMDGGDGGPSFAIDATSNTTLFVLAASSGGQGGTAATGPGRGGASYPGFGGSVHIPKSSDAAGPPYGSGFVACGGLGGAVPGPPATAGQRNLASALLPGAGTFWNPGAAGAFAAGDAGNGAGGGAGIFAPGGNGGDSNAGGAPGGNGSTSAPNSGGGAGGGAGGTNAGDAGGNGGPGSTGRVRLIVIAP
jgi:hypothetical protein